MVDKSKDNQLDSEIAKRLDDLFGEGDLFSKEDNPIEAKETAVKESQSKKKSASSDHEEILDLADATLDEPDDERAPDDYPLAELKNLVLSIDWEITDDALADFISQVNNLKVTYKNEKIVLMFLQLLGSLGVYIKTNRGNAHPKTFKILNSVFSRLEEVVRSEDMTEAQKKKILQTEMNRYKQLRHQVSKKKAAKVGRKNVVSAPKEWAPRIKATQKKEAARLDNKSSEKAAEKSQSPPSKTPRSYADLAEAVEDLKKFFHSELNALKQELRILQKSK